MLSVHNEWAGLTVWGANRIEFRYKSTLYRHFGVQYNVHFY
jgi:hypothetical protein